MYFWKINDLRRDLIEKPLSEKDQLKYLLAYTILVSLALMIYTVTKYNAWNIYYSIIGMIIEIIGIIYIYKINGGSKGEYILQRYFSLGWVVAIRWSVLIVLPTLIVYYTVLGIYYLRSGVTGSTTVYDGIVFSLIELIYFWLLGRHVKKVSLKFEPTE